MKTTRHRRRWTGLWFVVALAGVLAVGALAPSDVLAQGRGPGGRSRDSGGGPSRGDSGPSRREESSPPSRRSEEQRPPTRREEYTPPQRREEQRPPTRREEYTPAQRREERRPPTRREEYTPPQRREEQRPPTRREEYTPPQRREEQRPPVRREEIGPGLRRDNQGDRNNRGGIGDLGSRYDRSGRDNPGDRRSGPGLDRGPGDRSNPGGSRYDRTVRDGAGDRRPGAGIDRRPGNQRGDVRRGDNRDGRDGRDGSRYDHSRRPGPSRNDAFAIFTRSREARRFPNGISLRGSVHVAHPQVRRYFRDSYSYYPWYAPAFNVSLHYYSPYSYYWGVCPPYILRRHTWYAAPRVVYIEIPIYVGNRARGYEGDDYYLNDRYGGARYEDPGLANAVDDLEAAFRWGEIERMVNLTDPQVRIAVYRRGQYDYSLSADDYLDMTRDAMRNMDTYEFDLYRVRRRAADVYTVSGRHDFRDGSGGRRTVFVSFVLERVYGRWTITQVGTSPDEYRN